MGVYRLYFKIFIIYFLKTKIQMQTAVTIIKCIQTGIDNYKDVRATKIFDDNATLLEIKEWIKSEDETTKRDASEISLASVDFSDVIK